MLIDKISNKINLKTQTIEQKNINSRIQRPTYIGIWILFLFFGVFGTWATFAPIDSFVRGQGNIVHKDRNQIIQHLEGGIIDMIHTEEGDMVEEGQILISLKSHATQSNNFNLQEQFCTLQTTKQRLLAEKNSQDTISFDQIDNECAKNKDLLFSQEQIFKMRKIEIENKINLIEHHTEELQKEIEATIQQQQANKIQIELNKEELNDAQNLFNKGIIQKKQLISLQQTNAELMGKEGVYNASIAKIMQQISEDKIKINNIKNVFLYDIEKELKELNYNIAIIQEKKIASDDAIERLTIRSPKNGIVKDLRYHTVGGIINPSAAIMEIAPISSDIIIEARISNKDIAALMSINKNILNPQFLSENPILAKTRIITYSSKISPFIDSLIYSISADAFLDNKNIMGYYMIYARIPQSSFNKLYNNISIYPGMPIEIYIPTSSRTLLSYLFKPIMLSFDRAFRET